MNKVCTKCGVEKPQGEFRSFWDRRKGTTLYYRSGCKKCESLWAKEYEKRNPDKKKIYRQRWFDRNPDKVKVAHEKWKTEHPDAYRLSTLKGVIKWKKKNMEKVRLYGRRSHYKRRSQKLATPLEKVISVKDQLLLRDKAVLYGKCWLCGEFPDAQNQLTLDHAFPLARGGQHTKENAHYICRSCNSTKRHRTLEEFCGKSLADCPYL